MTDLFCNVQFDCYLAPLREKLGHSDFDLRITVILGLISLSPVADWRSTRISISFQVSKLPSSD